jgi:hypothetical protein
MKYKCSFYITITPFGDMSSQKQVCIFEINIKFAWTLWDPRFSPIQAEIYIALIHNILSLRGRLVSFGMAVSGACGELEDVLPAGC